MAKKKGKQCSLPDTEHPFKMGWIILLIGGCRFSGLEPPDWLKMPKHTWGEV